MIRSGLLMPLIVIPGDCHRADDAERASGKEPLTYRDPAGNDEYDGVVAAARRAPIHNCLLVRGGDGVLQRAQRRRIAAAVKRV